MIHLPRLANLLARVLLTRVATRAPDFIVGADSDHGAYLHRWYLTPWRRLRDRAQTRPTLANRAAARVSAWLPNLYLHKFMRDDDARALHDHPSWAISFILRGQYVEHTIAAGGIHRRRMFQAGALRYMPTQHAHRIELIGSWWDKDTFEEACATFAVDPSAKSPCYTLFLFGPTVRNWGFHCPQRGWVPWQQFTAADRPGEIGPGCDA